MAGPTPSVRGPAPPHIGKFKVVGPLGEGGMGIVVAASDEALRRTVAVKVLRTRGTAVAGEARERLLREARAMAGITHPNVLTVFEVGTVDEDVFIAMELASGGTLRHWVARKRPWREIVAKYVEAARGLEAAHLAGHVHRDFKPDNISTREIQYRLREYQEGAASGHATPSHADEDEDGDRVRRPAH